MEAAKQKLLEQTHQTILKVGFENNDYEVIADLISPNFVGLGTALDEKIFGIKDLKALLKRQKEQSKGIDINVALSTLHTHLSENENTAIYIDEGVLSIKTDEEPIEMILRLSLVLEYIEDKWLMIHFHSSKPEEVESEKDTWGIETWKEKAEALEKEVAERTADLVLKNRDLEVEAALERVRARSMAMHSSDELNQVVAVLFENLKELQIPVTAAGIQIYLEDSEDMLNYVCGENSEGLVISHYRMPYFDNAIINDFRNARESQNEFFVGNYSKKVKDSFYTYLFENTDIKDVPEDIKQMIFDSPAYTISMAAVSNSLIAINDFQGNQLSENNVAIIKRFAKAFEQAYIRFRDLQKAEAQAREAQIEAALERVRSRSLAMQKSIELLEVISVVSQQLQTLDFRFSHVSFINNSLKEYNSFWVAATGLPNPMRFIIPYKAMPVIDNLRKAQKNKDAFYTDVCTVKEHQQWFEHLLKHSGQNVFPKEIIDYQMSKGLARSISIHTNIMLALANTQSIPYSDYENKIIARFGQVFEQSYTRFLDLQRAEAQVKEAQIEAALERVRSRSMGMQKSEELEEIIQVVFDQFIQLGITVDHSGFIMDYKSRDDMHIWLADQHKITSQITLPYFDSPHWNSYNEAKKKGDNLFLNHLNFKEKNKFYKEIFKYVPDLPEDAKTFYLQCPSLTIATTLADNIGLYIENYSGIQYSEDDQKTLIRFGRVFQQTYTRFLDLKKAEAQAREAQIEAALEKVRSRTMAMQKSEELPLAANNLFLQVQELGIPAWSAGYCIWQDDKHNAYCNMSSEGEIQKGFVLPSIGEGYDFYTPQENGERFYVKELGGEALVKHYEFMKQLPNMGEILQELIDTGLELPTFQIFHIVYFKFGYVMFITYKEVPEAHDIFKRFGQVFEQTYTRFLDLERAEAQAREARIEMALEKIRSRTMAMQHSNELREAAQLLFNEVRALGIPSWSCGYNILSDDKKSAECWMSSEGTLQKPFTLIYEKEESFTEMYDFFKGDDTFLIQELSGTALQSHYDYLKSFPNLVPIFNDLQKAEISLPTYQINHLCKFSQGYLLFITYEPVPEAHELFVRFTKVFEQTYTRFLDLKQAEARARESQIQTALERVRSHSMGMQSTADFANVTTEMFNQLRSFGEDLFATGIVFCDKHEGHVEQWHSIPGAGMLSPMIVPIDLDYIHQYRYDQWKAGTTLFSIEIPSDFIEQHFEAIFKLPSAQVTLKDLESRNAPMPAPPDWEIDYGASFKHGYILASSLKPIENMDILPRFAQVFEQAYIRFLDLQKAEAQARESQIEAALEKVRSRTLAMQKSDELADTSVVVFKELLALGIEPNRLFIGIVKDNGDAIDAWATNEDGSKIEQHFKLYTSKNKSIQKMVEGWKQQKKSAIIDMEGKELQEYFHYLDKVMHIPFIDGLKQKRRVQSIAYFSGGLIGMAAPAEQPEETINLLERFAAVFNLTYTRFNDLKIAEAQAKQAEEDLINLQKAKKNAEKALAELQNTQKQLIQSEKMASLGELTAGIAHEIQNPLNFVNNFSEVSKELLSEMLEEIENGDMDEVRAIMNDVIQNLEKINHHGQRADGIVKGMLQHSRASGDKKEATDINALADEYLRLAYHGLRAKDKSFNAHLVTDFDESVGKVDVIPQDIGRVILNLLTNAFYAVNEKQKTGLENYEPAVSMSTKKLKNILEIIVTDNGNGISERVLDKIFQPFFTTKPTGQGTGLGLSMSYDIVTKGHGGELSVETTEGKGTTFNITIPIIN